MRLEGGCYCGAVRYAVEGEPILRAQCHCRACQHIAGGAPNLFMLMPAEGFAYTKGAPKTYTRPDKADAVTREFCAVCGTHMITRRPGRRKASRSILLRTACPPSTACRRDNSSNQPRRWHCSKRSAKGAGTTDIQAFIGNASAYWV